MTLDVATPYQTHTVAGIGPYAASWPYVAGALRVSVRGADGIPVALASPADWSVSPASTSLSGNVTLTPAAAALHVGKTLILERVTPDDQGWEGNRSALDIGIMTQLDQIVMAAQELRAKAARTLQATVNLPPFTPGAIGTTLIWNGTGFVPGPSADDIAGAQDAAIAAQAAAALAVLNGGSAFGSRAAAMAAYIPAPVQTIAWLDGGIWLLGRRDPLGTALATDGGTVWWSPAQDPTPHHWGAQGDGTIFDDTAATQAGITYAKTYGATLRGVPGKTYRITAPLDPSLPNGTNVIWGMDFTGAELRQDFTGHGLVCLDFSRAGARCGGVVRLKGLRFSNGAYAVDPPVMLDISGSANFVLEDIHFEGTTNTAFRADSMYNNRLERITSYYGGRHFPYRSTVGVTFSITVGTTALTSSAAHFVAGDVGQRISLENPATARREIYTIAAFVSSTQVTVAEASRSTFAAVAGNWEGARVTVTGASATIVGANWPADVAGLAIYIAGTAADTTPQRRTIQTRNSDTVVTLDTAVTTNVVSARFVCPAIDIGSEAFYAGPGASSGESNDIKISNLWIENPRGVGLVVNDMTDGYFTTPKIHGEAQPDGNTAATSAHAWLIKCQAEFSGTELHADNVAGAKIVSFGLDGKLHFGGHTRAQLALNQRLVEHFATQTGGVVEVESIEAIGSVAKVLELEDEVYAAAGKTLFGSISQAGQVPSFPPTEPRGVRVISSNVTESHTYSHVQPNNILHTGTLGSAVNLNLASVSGGGRQKHGDTVRVTRTGSGAGALNLRDGLSAVTLKALATGQWADATWNKDTGAWYLSGQGTL